MVSGSWDGSARIWKVGKWECDAILEGHQGSVWTVLAYDRKTIITGERRSWIWALAIADKHYQVARTRSFGSSTREANYFVRSRAVQM